MKHGDGIVGKLAGGGSSTTVGVKSPSHEQAAFGGVRMIVGEKIRLQPAKIIEKVSFSRAV